MIFQISGGPFEAVRDYYGVSRQDECISTGRERPGSSRLLKKGWAGGAGKSADPCPACVFKSPSHFLDTYSPCNDLNLSTGSSNGRPNVKNVYRGHHLRTLPSKSNKGGNHYKMAAKLKSTPKNCDSLDDFPGPSNFIVENIMPNDPRCIWSYRLKGNSDVFVYKPQRIFKIMCLLAFSQGHVSIPCSQRASGCSICQRLSHLYSF